LGTKTSEKKVMTKKLPYNEKCTRDKKIKAKKNAFEKVSTLYPRPYTTYEPFR